jgi:NADH-quinone oxidoreductase subunit G
VLRRSSALNAHPLNRAPAVRINADEAQRQGLTGSTKVQTGQVQLPLVIDASVPDGTAWIEAAQDSTAALPPYGAPITLSKA